jgi:hypothetical protein
MTGLVARRITLTATHLMNTEQLILNLSADVPRVYRHALIERIASGVGGGALVALMLVVAILGVRPDLQHAMQAFSFWMKWAYTISLGAGALYAVIRLSRPTPSSLCGLWLLAVPILLLIGVGIGELANTPRSEWLSLWQGRSWKVCPRLLLTLAVPIFVGLLWSSHRLAPTRLHAAGAAAGLAAGATAATIYGLHCAEVSALFVLTWYSLGMLLAAAAGAMLGPRLLRW